MRGRRWSIGVVVALLLVAGAAAWRRCGSGGAATGETEVSGTEPATGTGAGAGRVGKKADDPRMRARGAIAGAVRDEAGAAIAGATVCATWGGHDLSSEETREPICTTADAKGAFALADLVPATYTISAAAPKHGYAAWEDGEHHGDLRLGAGEARTGIDIVLGDGVEVHGVVADINGGPIAGAMVRVGTWMDTAHGGWVRTKDDGTFTLWTKAGQVNVMASAEGYSPGTKSVAEPGSFAEVLLTPEGVLAGTVVEAGTKKPVAGAMVSLDTDWDGSDDSGTSSARSDERGHFRITRLRPGRYKPQARGDDYYGEPIESVLLALGQTVDDVVIEVHPAVTVQGRVVIDADGKRTPCARANLWMQDSKSTLSHNVDSDPDGTITIKGVLPGSYHVEVWCENQLSKDHYDAIVVATKDVKGLEWVVGPGGTIRGRVHDGKGEPVAGAQISTSTTGGDPRAQRSWGWKKTEKDGTFVVSGLVPGSYAVHASADGYPTPKDPTKVLVPVKGEATADITIETGGTVHGVVVDEGGHGVGGVTVRAEGKRWGWYNGDARTADDGSFTMKGVDAGPARVVAQRGWTDALRTPGSHDDDTQGKKVTVIAGATIEVRLVVESQSGTITGVVVDGKGTAISDAYITSQRESDAAGAAQGSALRQSRWGDWNKRPVVTAVDGSFKLTELAPGAYTVRAFRKGGGEAVTEHVMVGGSARLEMKVAGAITGAVSIVGGGTPGVFFVSVADQKRGFSRSESFYATGGAWAIRDLPAGGYLVTVTAAEGRATTEVALGDGETKDGVTLALEKMVAVRGRLVEIGTGAPVPGIAIGVVAAKGNSGFEMSFDGDDPARTFISDAQGQFQVARAPLGRDFVQGYPIDWQGSPFGMARKLVVVREGEDVVDVGDIEMVKRRVKNGDRGGDLGITLAEQPPDLEPDQSRMQVSHLDPDGPAVASGIKVGDVIVSVDGIDVRGDRIYLAYTLMDVPTGTTVKLGLERGPTVAVTAGPPS